jgi:CubicO group peptidase (beta-lactamase class C family)
MAELPRDDLSRRIRTVQSEQRLPALVGAVFQRGELVWSEAAGLANVEDERPVSVDDQFRVGSITKTFVAVAILQLRDEGALELDDPVERHVTEVPHTGATLRRLLAHASGLQREPAGNVWATLELPDRDAFLASLAEAEQVLAPGLAWHYSNLAFVLLGDVVGRLRGELPEEAIERTVLRPLGLERTSWLPLAPHAQGYLVEPWHDGVRREHHVELGALASLGQLWSTAGDLARWGDFMSEPDPAVLAADTAREMHALQAMADEKWHRGWGLGVALLRSGDRIFGGHGGAMPGFLASLTWDRETRTGAVVLTNSGANAPVEVLGLELADHAATAFAVEPKEWRPADALPAELEGVVGRWWSEGEEMILQLRGDELQVPAAKAGEPPSRLVREGVDRYRTATGHFRGELLLVERDETGAATKLWWGTYPLTRGPETFAQQEDEAGGVSPPPAPSPPGLLGED